jgi:hypothetical protein
MWITTVAPAQPHDAPGVTAKDLLAPEMFPGASMGMVVDDAADGAVATVRTLGAEFLIDKAADTIECRQRIAAKRPVAKIKLPAGSLAGITLSHKSVGAAIFTGKSTVRINGDSLVMIAPGIDGPITAELLFTPDYFSQYVGNFNFFDPVGGIAFFEHGQQPQASTQLSRDPCTVTWAWKAGDVLWAGVSPPKPFDWKRSVEDKYVVYGSSYQRYMYPDDLAIKRWREQGNVLMFHCENAWVHWQMDLTPRDLESHKRMLKTAREFGMKVAFYTSPKAFLKGSPIESRATPDVNDPKASGWPTGGNVKEYLTQAQRLVKEFGVTGLYFDEMYCMPSSLASSYFLARSCRELLGDSNPLMYHCTEDVLGDRQQGELFGRTNCPAVHAYFDVLMKGEGVWDRFDPAYLRYVLGSYNLSNTMVNAAMNKGLGGLTYDRVDRYFRGANTRFFVMEHEAYTGEMDVFRNVYLYRLTPMLQRQIEPDLLRPTGVFEQYRKSVGNRQ